MRRSPVRAHHGAGELERAYQWSVNVCGDGDPCAHPLEGTERCVAAAGDAAHYRGGAPGRRAARPAGQRRPRRSHAAGAAAAVPARGGSVRPYAAGA